MNSGRAFRRGDWALMRRLRGRLRGVEVLGLMHVISLLDHFHDADVGVCRDSRFPWRAAIISPSTKLTRTLVRSFKRLEFFLVIGRKILDLPHSYFLRLAHHHHRWIVHLSPPSCHCRCLVLPSWSGFKLHRQTLHRQTALIAAPPSNLCRLVFVL